MSKLSISSCFPININVHKLMSNSRSPAKYLDTRSPNQFRTPRLRNVKWFQYMTSNTQNATRNDNQEEDDNLPEEVRTVGPEDLQNRFNGGDA